MHVEVARAAGEVVRRERTQGQGQVVRRMFADIDAGHLCAGRRRRDLGRLEAPRMTMRGSPTT